MIEQEPNAARRTMDVEFDPVEVGMQRKRLRAVLAGAALVAGTFAVTSAGSPAHAYDDCKDGTIGGWLGTPSAKGHIVVPIEAGSETLYVDVREFMGQRYSWSIWLYREANGKSGLQRGGSTENSSVAPAWGVAGHFDDPCQQSSNPDEIIF